MTTRAEWAGDPLKCGRTDQQNIMTSTSARIPNGIKCGDAVPEQMAEVVAAVEQHRKSRRDMVETLHATIHGVDVTFVTNSRHLVRQFQRNWFHERSDSAMPLQERVIVTAMIDVPGWAAAACYSDQGHALWFINVAFYGQIKSWLLGAVARILASRQGVHSIHGSCVDIEGEGLLLIAPSGTGKTTSTYGMVQGATLAETRRLHSDDWVFVRYLAQDSTQSRHNLIAKAYISERAYYIRTNLVASFPRCIPAFLDNDIENVPALTSPIRSRHGVEGYQLTREYMGLHAGIKAHRLTDDVTRLIANDSARCMVYPENLVGASRAVTDPTEGVPIGATVLLTRDSGSEVVVRRLTEAMFVGMLLEGRTPFGGADTVFNAYRLVDDAQEREYVDARQGDHAALLAVAGDPNAPATLREEASMFALLWRSTRTYLVNTILRNVGGLELPAAANATQQLLEAIAKDQVADTVMLRDVVLTPSR
jgi:hypothetical protein